MNGCRKPERSFALVITLMMVVLAAVVVIAFVLSASSERFTANAYSKRARAEMAAQSGLAAALNALVGANGPNDFRFVTAVGDSGQPALTLMTYNSTTGVVALDPNPNNKRLLYSVTPPGAPSPAPTTTPIALSTVIKSPGPVGFVPLMTKDQNGNDQESERYAFYIDEAGSRQNLSVQAGSDRGYARDPNELPLVTATAAPTAFNTTQISTLASQRSLLLTALTANSILSTNAVSPLIDNYSYTTNSSIADLTPEGKPRVNLKLLKDYIETLSVDQAKNNPRSKLIDRLLDPNEVGTDWGADDGNGNKLPGGNLSILTKLGHYSSTQQQQIIANLIDYLDSDLIPTTDDVDNPKYFGGEGKAGSTGNVVGHPYINFVGTGLVFNRSSSPPGALNSTRVLLFIGVVNPWSSKTKAWETFYIQPEIEIQMGGTASGGTLGTNAGAYFHSAFSVTEDSNHLLEYPVSTLDPNTGFLFPHTVAGSVGQYANFDNLVGDGQQQPPGMTFTNLTFTIKKLRLKYTSTDGRNGYIQVLDGLQAITQPMSQTTVNMGATSGALTYRLGQTGNTTKTDFHLNGDARLNLDWHRWALSKSTASTNSDPVAPPAPNPTTGINVFSGIDSNNYDFAGNAPSVTDYTWYTKVDITSNFYVKSPPSDATAPTLDSTGEFGYLHTGIPWETLRLYVTGNEANSKQRDKELLAYVESGTFSSGDYRTIPTHVGQTNPATPPASLSGPINLNSNKRPTLQSLFLGASAVADSDAKSRASSGVADPDASTLADQIAQNAGTAPFALVSDYLSLANVKAVTNAQTTDFNREVLARRTANVIGTQSTRFTVYAVGEARDKAGSGTVASSTVNLRAEVELQTDSNGKPMPRVLSTAYYLTQ